MEASIPNPKVTCVLWGTLQHRGRLLKQIAALQAAGIECRLIYGDRGEVPLRKDDFNFPIEVIPTPWQGHPFVLFLRQLRFCFKTAPRIAASDATHALCFSLTTALAGVLAKRKRPELKVVFDSNELHIEAYIHPVKRRLWALVQKFCVPRCDVIMHAEGNRLDYFRRRHDPHPGQRVHFLLENFPYHIPGERLRPKPPQPPTRVLYVGVMGPDRYTREMIDIFRGLAPDYTLDLVGPGSHAFKQELEAKLASNPAPNVRILPAIRHDGMSNLIQDYHIGVALYRNDNLCNYYCAPNKVYDYLMNGVPVVANDYPGLHKVLEDGRLGACVKEVTLEHFRTALDTLVRERRWENITEDVRRRYSWEAQNPGFLALFR